MRTGTVKSIWKASQATAAPRCLKTSAAATRSKRNGRRHRSTTRRRQKSTPPLVAEGRRTMLVHGFVPVSRANGPGRRAVLWFQGCTLNCPGCFNQASHPFEGAPTDDDASDIVRRVLALHHAGEIEGLTFSGGEPMQQASSVLELIERLRETDATPPLTFGMFTGYTVGELDQGRYFT